MSFLNKIVGNFNQVSRRVPSWVVYVLGMLPVPWLLYLGQTGGLGREPIHALERELGEFALQLIILGLCVTPLRRWAGINLLKFRRAIGVLAFVYVSLHLLTWLVLDVRILSQIWSAIVKQPYITIGMVAFVLMLPLAITSNNTSVRRLGPIWRRLHKLAYPIAVLGALHFILIAKGFQIEPLIYMAVTLALLGLRAVPRRVL